MLYAGVDIGGQSIPVGIVDDKWNILAEDVVQMDHRQTPFEAMGDVAKMIRKLCAGIGAEAGSLAGIGVGVPAVVIDGYAETLTNVPGWDDLYFGKLLGEHLGRDDIIAANDANAAMLAEWKLGALRCADVGVLLTLGTGVGGAMIIDGKPFVGSHKAGEQMGHIVIDCNGAPCGCGRTGCFEAMANSASFARYGKEEAERAPQSLLNGYETITGGNIGRSTKGR